MHMRALSILMVCLVSLPAAADGLSDLRATLERFPARAAISAMATIRVDDNTEAGARKGLSNFAVESSPAGFAIRVLPEALDRAEVEARDKKRDPESATPTRTAMVALTVFDVMDSLDAAGMLLNDLSGAKLVESAPTRYQGKAATLLRISVKPTLAGTRSRFVNEPKVELRVWSGADGVPFAAERDSNYSASFLFVKAGNVRKEHWDLAVRGDRLYALRNHETNRASVAGKSMVSSRSVSYSLD